MNADRRYRILMVISQLGYGGAEGAFLRLATYLSRHADITIAMMARDYGDSVYSVSGSSTDLPCIVLDELPRAQRKDTNKLARWWRMLRRLRSLKQEHDVAISFLSGANLLNALTGPRTKTIVSERGSKKYHVGLSRWSKILWLGFLDPLVYWRCGAIVPASHGYETEILDIAGPGCRNKVRAIEGCILSEQLLDAVDQESDVDIKHYCNASTIVYSGRIDAGKGLDLIMPAFRHLYSLDQNARLLIIGEGPQETEIVDFCNEHRLPITKTGQPDAAVFFAGFRRYPHRNFRHATVYIFPSLHEGLPNALIEAVASGITILAADCPWGPRSVLSGPSDRVAAAVPVGRPVELAYGTLMPLPDSAAAVDIWATEMAAALQRGRRSTSREERRKAIARFDIENTGPVWLALARQLSGHDVPEGGSAKRGRDRHDRQARI